MGRFRWRLTVLLAKLRFRVRAVARAPLVYRNWWGIVLPKLGVATVIELGSGLKFHARAHKPDLGMIADLTGPESYLSHGFDDLPRNGTVLDVGANVGVFTCQAARLVPAGRVYAIEPVREHVEQIESNRRL